MCAGLPLLFQHPGPVGCSPAVLHLCFEDPGALETEWRGGCYTVSGREKKKMGRKEGEEKVGQDRLIGGAGDSKNAVSGKSDASTRVLDFWLTCRRVKLSQYMFTVKY